MLSADKVNTRASQFRDTVLQDQQAASTESTFLLQLPGIFLLRDKWWLSLLGCVTYGDMKGATWIEPSVPS